MREYLFFTLRGPLQSWGTSSAVGEVRATAGHPGRSAVVGLVAAALGIRRAQSETLLALHHAIRLAVRQDRHQGDRRISGVQGAAPDVERDRHQEIPTGGRMVDFHTAQAPSGTGRRVFRTRRDELVTLLGKDEDVNTILSRREYLTAAAFTACLWLEGTAPMTLEAMCAALERPLLPLYLGRKCCPPGFPLLPCTVRAANMGEAFARYDAFRKERAGADACVAGTQIWADAGQTLPEAQSCLELTVRDVVTDVRRRQFLQRQELFYIPKQDHVGETAEAVHVHKQD